MAGEPELTFLKQLRSPRTAGAGWSFFVERYSGLILQTIHNFEAEYDQVLDRYLYVCTKLAEGQGERLKKFRHGGEGDFCAWLRAVVRNLCIDYLREQSGRRRLPSAIARMTALDQDVFRAVFWDGWNASQTFEHLRTGRPQLSFAAVLESLERIQAAVQPWRLALIAQSPGQRANPAHPTTADEVLDQMPDEKPGPEADALLQEQFTLLHSAVSELPDADRLLLRLRFEMSLTLQQVATASGLGDHRKVHAALARILERLREGFKLLGERGGK